MLKFSDYINEECINEEFSSAMKSKIPAEVLKKIGIALSNDSVDVKNTTFTHVAGPTELSVYRPVYIITYFSFPTPSFAVFEIGNDTNRFYLTKSNMTKKLTKNKAAETADAIFIIKKEDLVITSDKRYQRMISKDGATALERKAGAYFRDKSGYDVGKAQSDLKLRAFDKNYDKIFDSAMKKLDGFIKKTYQDLSVLTKNGDLTSTELRKLGDNLITLGGTVKSLYKSDGKYAEKVLKDIEINF